MRIDMPKEPFRDSDNQEQRLPIYGGIPEIYGKSRLGREGLNSPVL
jgi:hypothetical protein